MQIKKARRKGKNVSTRGWLKEKSKRGKQEVKKAGAHIIARTSGKQEGLAGREKRQRGRLDELIQRGSVEA
jgi:hypothetical protein